MFKEKQHIFITIAITAIIFCEAHLSKERLLLSQIQLLKHHLTSTFDLVTVHSTQPNKSREATVQHWNK